MGKNVPEPSLRFHALAKLNQGKSSRRKWGKWEEKLSCQVGVFHDQSRNEEWARKLKDKVVWRDLIIRS